MTSGADPEAVRAKAESLDLAFAASISPHGTQCGIGVLQIALLQIALLVTAATSVAYSVQIVQVCRVPLRAPEKMYLM